jgi:hypothetical protein
VSDDTETAEFLHGMLEIAAIPVREDLKRAIASIRSDFVKAHADGSNRMGFACGDAAAQALGQIIDALVSRCDQFWRKLGLLHLDPLAVCGSEAQAQAQAIRSVLRELLEEGPSLRAAEDLLARAEKDAITRSRNAGQLIGTGITPPVSVGSVGSPQPSVWTVSGQNIIVGSAVTGNLSQVASQGLLPADIAAVLEELKDVLDAALRERDPAAHAEATELLSAASEEVTKPDGQRRNTVVAAVLTKLAQIGTGIQGLEKLEALVRRLLDTFGLP